jgi:hypothetical protein
MTLDAARTADGAASGHVPLPLPTPGDVLTSPPNASEVQVLARLLAQAVAPPAGLAEVQRLLIESVCEAMTGHPVICGSLERVSPEELAELMGRRSLQERTGLVQLTLLFALVLRPLPSEVVDRIAALAAHLGVDEEMVGVACRLAHGSYGLAAIDFERNGYTATWRPEDAAVLKTSAELRSAWDLCVDDPALAARWAALEALAPGTLGRQVWELYRSRGFRYPGTPDSAPPLLAQHDWVHVLADYGTTVEGELEVFTFIARANDDPRAFSLLAMVVSLFETGYLATGAGFFHASPGHVSANRSIAVRIADAMRRGALGRDEITRSDSIDYLRLDWFAIADMTLDEARKRFGVVPKSMKARSAGSVGPWEPGGTTEFQDAAGRELARQSARRGK